MKTDERGETRDESQKGGRIVPVREADGLAASHRICGPDLHHQRGFPGSRELRVGSTDSTSSSFFPSNIAEGNSRSSDVDFARFVEIAYGSLMETVTQLHIARRRNFCSEEHFHTALTLADEVARMLSGLRTNLVGRR